jgi:NAD-dependent dihydropyrimidine dehydrogenase PreA subunit
MAGYEETTMPGGDDCGGDQSSVSIGRVEALLRGLQLSSAREDYLRKRAAKLESQGNVSELEKLVRQIENLSLKLQAEDGAVEAEDSARQKRKAESDGVVSSAQGGSPEKDPPTKKEKRKHNEYLVRTGHAAYIDRGRPQGEEDVIFSTNHKALQAIREMAETIEGGPEVWDKWRANLEGRDLDEMNPCALSVQYTPTEMLQQIHPDLSPHKPLPAGDHEDWAKQLRQRLRDDEASPWHRDRIRATAMVKGAVAERDETRKRLATELLQTLSTGDGWIDLEVFEQNILEVQRQMRALKAADPNSYENADVPDEGKSYTLYSVLYARAKAAVCGSCTRHCPNESCRKVWARIDVWKPQHGGLLCIIDPKIDMVRLPAYLSRYQDAGARRFCEQNGAQRFTCLDPLE